MKEKGKKISIVIFYEPGGDIVFQERGKASKLGEKYAFFGGGIEEGESSLGALKRELSEELGYQSSDLTFWMKYSFVLKEKEYKGWKIDCDVYLSPIINELLSSVILEGDSIVRMHIDKAILDPGFHERDRILLKKFKDSLYLS